MSQRRVRTDTTPTVAVVGRPNVGKSTLVNRLTGRRDAIVQEKPGVTRDRTTHIAEWRGRRVTVIDTGGWTPGWSRPIGDDGGDKSRRGVEDPMHAAVSAQAERSTTEADLVVFVVDAMVGITEEDAAVAGWLRTAAVRVLLVANKVDNRALDAQLPELYGLGVGEPLAVSALHGHGSGDLLDAVWRALGASGAFARPAAAAADVPGVALIGRPNVGKSSLFNRLVGSDRTIVDDRPGTTRDAVDTVIEVGGRAYRFVDTAGLRRKFARKGDATEYYSTVRTVQALDSASVALLVIDAHAEIGEQEQKLARQVVDAGRALVLVLNKWDLLDEYRREVLDREREFLLSFVEWAEVVRTSATSGRNLDKLFPAIDRALASFSTRIPTATLNDWLADAVAAHAPPLHVGTPVRVRYITQVAVAPPTFRVFTTAAVPPAYERYLVRRLRETYGFGGTPIDLGVRVRTRWEDRDGYQAPARRKGAGSGRGGAGRTDGSGRGGRPGGKGAKGSSRRRG